MDTNKIETKEGWFIGGGVLASLIASFCCTGPLILTVLGISSAAALAKLEVLRVPMISLILIFWGVARFAHYRKRNTCTPGSICANPRKYKKLLALNESVWVSLLWE